MRISNPVITKFTDLSDVPHSYVGAASKVATVNAGETGLEFDPGGGGGTPGGSNTQIQFNDSSSFGGDADFTWNKTTNILGIAGDITFGTDSVPTARSINVTAQTTTNKAGNSLYISSGTSNGTGVGGDLDLSAGVASGSGDGGYAALSAGSSTTGKGGRTYIYGGQGYPNGDVWIQGGANLADIGGNVYIRGGDSDVAIGGDVLVYAGNGHPGGKIQFTSYFGGEMRFSAGSGQEDLGVDGGSFFMNAGAGGTNANKSGGNLSLNAGAGGGTSGGGGGLSLSCGSAVAGNSNGGSMTFTTGLKTGSGVSGKFYFYPLGGSTVAGILDFDSLATTDKTFTFPNTTGTVALTSDIPTTASGTYSPTFTSVANLDSTPTGNAQYMRIGTVVTVSGEFTANPTLAATQTTFGMSISVASNFANSYNCGGTAFCGNIAGMGAAVNADATNDRANITWVSSDLNSQTWSFTFSYSII